MVGDQIGIGPKGPAIDPSGFWGPWPDIYAWFPLTRTHAKGVWISGGNLGGSGILRPRETILVSIRSRLLILLPSRYLTIRSFDIKTRIKKC